MSYVMMFACPLANVHAPIRQDFGQFVDETIVESHKSVQRGFEQSLLTQTLNGRDNDDETVVHLQLGIFSEEVPSIIGDEDVIVFGYEAHQIVILPTTFSDPAYMICCYPALLGESDQADAQAFIHEKPVSQCEGSGIRRQSGPYFASAQRITASMPSTGKVG
jgi:hypothetical protein